MFVPDPLTRLYYYEDYTAVPTNAVANPSFSSGFAVSSLGTGAGNDGTSAGAVRPGVIVLKTGTTTTGWATVGSNTDWMFLVTGPARYVVSTYVQGPASSSGQNFVLAHGFGDWTQDANNLASPDDGAFFIYDTQGSVAGNTSPNGNWKCMTSVNGSRTVVDSGVAVGIDQYVTLQVTANQPAGNVKFYIDGTLVATITTNVPGGATQSTGYGSGIFKRAGTTNRVTLIDMTFVEQVIPSTNRGSIIDY
jgi:hypothetical protein